MQVRQHKVLIVEDDASIRDLYRIKFSTNGYQVQVAHHGKQGLKLAEEFLPHLILLDLRMPEMNGDEMLARMRSTDWGSDIRVIILTNISKDEAPHQLRFLNVDRYIVKAHYTPTQVVKVAQEVLGF